MDDFATKKKKPFLNTKKNRTKPEEFKPVRKKKLKISIVNQLKYKFLLKIHLKLRFRRGQWLMEKLENLSIKKYFES